MYQELRQIISAVRTAVAGRQLRWPRGVGAGGHVVPKQAAMWRQSRWLYGHVALEQQVMWSQSSGLCGARAEGHVAMWR